MDEAFASSYRGSQQWVSNMTEMIVEEMEQRPRKRVRTGHSCDICGTSYTEKRTLVRHLRTPAHCRKTGTRTPAYRCGYCGQNFSRDDLRSRHEKEVHFKIKRPSSLYQTSMISPESALIDTGYVAAEASYSLDATGMLGLTSTSVQRSNMNMEAVESRLPAPLVGHDRWADFDVVMPDAECEASNQTLVLDRNVDVSKTLPSNKRKADALDAESIRRCNPTSHTNGDDSSSIRSTSTFGSIKSRFKMSARSFRSSLVYRAAGPKVRGLKLPVQCIVCQEHLGRTMNDIRLHFSKHMKDFQTEHLCQTCDIRFSCERDLAHHEASASKGHCGFDFEHTLACEGHHPSDIYSEMLTDSDRLQFYLRLQHWEGAQFNAYLQQVNELISSDANSSSDCWTIGGIFSSRVSLASLKGYRKPSTLPDPRKYVGSQLRRDFGPQSEDLASQVFAGNVAAVSDLLVEGANIQRTHRFPLDHSDFPNETLTPLEIAVGQDNLEILEMLVTRDAKFSKHAAVSMKLLCYCADFDRLEMIQMLLNCGIDDSVSVNVMAIQSLTRKAPSPRREAILELLLGHVKDIVSFCDILNLAMECCDGQMIEMTLKRGVNMRADQHVPGCLHRAPLPPERKAEILLEYGPDLNVLYDVPTALEYAVIHRMREIVEMLLIRGACITERLE